MIVLSKFKNNSIKTFYELRKVSATASIARKENRAEENFDDELTSKKVPY